MGVRPEYIFRITNAYIKTNADNGEITTDSTLNRKWNKGYSSFKANIRNHLKIHQKGRCCFCRCYVSIGTSYSNLEHIVSKSSYPQFEFLTENLVYCCWLCNKGKGRRNTLAHPVANKNLQQYPNQSSGFLIVNPYHDNYERFIDFYDDLIILAKNNRRKGVSTIKHYNLTRPELAEERAREFKLNAQNVNHRLMQTLITYSTNANITNQINQVIAQLPNWTV
jgi:uncharacterized protein (TIGR02646 family)